MEDSVTEDERYQIPPMNHNSEDGSKRDDDDDDDGKEEKKEGFVSIEKEKQEDLDDSGGGGGGIINNFISNLMTPLSPRNGKATTEHENGNGNEVFERAEGTAVENNGGGEADKGVIRNLVSNFFHSTSSEGEEGKVLETEKKHKEVEEIIGDENKIKRQKTENGSIIHEIVSHLPPSLPGKYNKNLII